MSALASPRRPKHRERNVAYWPNADMTTRFAISTNASKADTRLTARRTTLNSSRRTRPRIGDNILDNGPLLVYWSLQPAHRRAHSGCDLEGGAGAVPAGGLANCSRAAPGHRSTGTTTGLRGARLTGGRMQRVMPDAAGL
jgi:hypothetical protein